MKVADFSALFFFFDHADGFGGTFFGTDPTTLAILEIDFDRNGALDYRVRTVKPADEARGTLVLGRSALTMIDLRPK